MKPLFASICLLSFNTVELTTNNGQVGLLDVLDSFTQVMTGHNGLFSRSLSIKLKVNPKSLPFSIFRVTFKHIKNAMWKFDPFIYESQNAGWDGLVKYFESNGGPGDQWGSNPTM